MPAHRSALEGFAIGTISGIVFGLLGFFILHKSPGMGITMFFLVPVSAGFAIAVVTKKGSRLPAAALVAALASLLTLIATGKEGVLCALMALPLILVGLTVGALLGLLYCRLMRREGQSVTAGMLLLMPALIFAGGKAELSQLEHARVQSFSTTIRVPQPPQRTWSYIESIDRISARKTWLMHFGLPVPQRCILEKTAVGAKRTCYFDSGYIEETVTGWNPPYSMELQINRTHLPGRHWLEFDQASYQLQADGNDTLLTRTTVIGSHLYPAWYWRPLEQLGIESEHRYILDEVLNRASR